MARAIGVVGRNDSISMAVFPSNAESSREWARPKFEKRHPIPQSLNSY